MATGLGGLRVREFGFGVDRAALNVGPTRDLN